MIAAVTWRQTLADVVLISAAVTAVLVLWARIFAGPIGRWIDQRITKFIEPLHTDITTLRADNARQHGEVQAEIKVLTARFDDHLTSVNGDGK